METTLSADPVVLVLAEGDTPAAVRNAKGHLFEEFAGRLLELHGYEEPQPRRVNVTSDGIELDLSLRHRLTGHRAIVECKCYSTPVKAPAATSFFGKLAKERLRDKNVHGFLIVTPRLSPEADEFVREVQESDAGLTVLTSRDIVGILRSHNLVPTLSLGNSYITDEALVITPYGMFVAGKENDPSTRIAQRVLVNGAAGPVPKAAVDLLAASQYSEELPVVDASAPIEPTAPPIEEPVIALVRGSRADFEYQFPASPEFFVGRKQSLQAVNGSLSDAPGVVVLNAQSGWGKSSLALRMASLATERGGHAIVIDTRTATSRRSFVSAALRRVAIEGQERGLLTLPENASWASLSTALATIASARWRRNAPLLVFFDQFENVFRDEELTRDFRDLALLVMEAKNPLIVGFAWKTDYIGWTESHPYTLIQDIRSVARVVNLDRFGPREVDTLMRRLERELGERLSPQLRRGLREYSQGLPWLFKKLADHLIAEVRTGATQEQLLSESLNVQSLFEADLAVLNAQEQEALRFVARFAPILATEVMDRYPAQIVRGLIDRRLIVQISERFDTYWDIFRDFLNTGRIPIEDSYTIRYAPLSVSRVLQEIERDGGTSNVQEVANRLQTSENSIWNMARELRVLGVSAYEPNHVRLVDHVWNSQNREETLRREVAKALRRHRAYSTLRTMAERSGNRVSLALYAQTLPNAFPAIEVAPQTWHAYARAFVLWFEYAGIAKFVGQHILMLPEGSAGVGRLFGARLPIRTKGVFPQEPVGPCIALLLKLVDGPLSMSTLDRYERDSLRQLLALGAVQPESNDTFRIARPNLVRDGKVIEDVLLELLLKVPGGSDALNLLKRNPAASPAEIGQIFQEAHSAEWKYATTQSVGKHFRGWARRAGLFTALRQAPRADAEGQPQSLFDAWSEGAQ
ncbi:restriction endonuclease [Micromonospora sp. NPDC047670]|uniref:nSTAND1 domain-containing NTPase n=1 Tax=Micromonospora sp. NPDC047670 TaxID=3364252 RepID=UPI003711B441